jgi:cytochrome c oxidase subunit 4
MANSTTDTHGPHGQGGDAAHTHAVPIKILLGVFAALLVLTIITVKVAGYEFGDYNIVIALAVAVIKGSLVAMYFMHLRWDAPFNGVILMIAMLFVGIFIAIALMDTHHYQMNLDTPPMHSTP